MLQRQRLSQLVLIVMVNVILFGVTPFLHCGGPSPQESSPQDASSTTPDNSTGNVTPELSNGPEPEPADWAKPNTPYETPKGAGAPGDSFDVKASGFSLDSSEDDKQICVVVDAPNTKDQLLHRFEPIVANKDIIQRVTLSYDEGEKREAWDCSKDDFSKEKLTPLFVWAPGVEAFQFPEKSGVLLPAGKRLRLTFVVKNNSGSAVELKSGVKVFPIATGGKAYKFWSNPVTDIKVRAGLAQRLSSICVFKQPATLLAGVPIMGKVGTQFISEIVSPDGSREELMFLNQWSPDKHTKMYSFPFTPKVGDTLSTSCSWRNPGEEDVTHGWKSNQERCDLPMYIDAKSIVMKELCSNDPTKPAYEPPPIKFKPGKCAPSDGLKTAKDVPLKAGLGSELDVDFGLKGGEWIKANWELQSGEVIFKSALIGSLLLTEFTMAAGQIQTGPTFTIDFVIQAVINLGERRVTYPFPISANGTFKKGAKDGEFSVDVKCGDFDHKNFTYEINGNTLQIGGVIKAQTQAGAIDYSLKLKFVKKE